MTGKSSFQHPWTMGMGGFVGPKSMTKTLCSPEGRKGGKSGVRESQLYMTQLGKWLATENGKC